MPLSKLLKLEDNRSVISIAGGGGKTTTLFALAEELVDYRVLITTTTKILMPDPSEFYDIVLDKDSSHFIEQIKGKQHKKHIVCGSSSNGYPGKLTGCSPLFIEEVHHLFDYVLIEADGSAGRPVKAPADHEPVISSLTDYYIGVIGLDCIGKAADDNYVHRPELFSVLRGENKDTLIDAEDLANLVNSRAGLFKNAPEQCRKIVLLNKADLIKRDQAYQLINTLADSVTGPMEIVLNSYKYDDPVIYNKTVLSD